MALDPAQALARLQGYQQMGRQLGLIKPQPQPTPQPRSIAEALYPRLPRDGDSIPTTTQPKGLR